LSSSPTEPLLSITTRMNPHDSSSFKRALHALQPGQELHLADPMGDFVLPKLASIPLVFVTAGLGVTPVRSMVQSLHDTHEQRNIRMLYATRYEDEAAFLPLLESYDLQLTRLVKQPSPGWQCESGSVTLGRILDMTKDLDEPYIYLSGPEPMVESLYKALIAEGVPNERLVTDYFPGYTQF
jgi:ferredoxin-NADP reductase